MSIATVAPAIPSPTVVTPAFAPVPARAAFVSAQPDDCGDRCVDGCHELCTTTISSLSSLVAALLGCCTGACCCAVGGISTAATASRCCSDEARHRAIALAKIGCGTTKAGCIAAIRFCFTPCRITKVFCRCCCPGTPVLHSSSKRREGCTPTVEAFNKAAMRKFTHFCLFQSIEEASWCPDCCCDACKCTTTLVTLEDRCNRYCMNTCFPNIGWKLAEERNERFTSDCRDDCYIAHAIDSCAGMDEFHAYAKAAHHRNASSAPIPPEFAAEAAAAYVAPPEGTAVVAPGGVVVSPPAERAMER